MQTDLPRTQATLRWALLAGASTIVLAGILSPSSGVAQTTETISGSVTSGRTISGGNSLLITSDGIVTLTYPNSITASGAVGSILNAGTIDAGFFTGITVASGATVGSIGNSGLIQAGTGIQISGASVNTISNSGSINANSQNAVRVDGAGSIGLIENTGTILTPSSDAFMVVMNSGSTIGTIRNSGVTSGSKSLLTLGGGTIGSFINSGEFTPATNSSSAAITVNGAGVVLTSFTNTGTITGIAPLNLINGSIGTIVNSGLLRGYGATAFYIAATGTLGSISNTGTLAGKFNNASSNALTITGGTGTVYGSLVGQADGYTGTITSAGNLTLGGNTFLGSNIAVSSGTGRVTNTGTLYTQRATTITGNYTQSPSATLIIGVGSFESGALTVSGSATLTNSSIVMEGARVGTGTLAGGDYTILSAGTAGSDFSGVNVTAPGFDGTVASTSTISGSTNNLVVTLTPTSRLYWDGDAGGNADNGTVEGGNGTWSSAGTNWTKADGTSNGTLSGGTITPYFQGTAGTVTVSGTVSAAGMTFGTDGYLLTGGAIRLTASPSTIVSDTGVTATIASSLTGTGGLYKSGAGTLMLSGTNSFTGSSTISAGTLVLSGGSALGDTTALLVDTGGTLQLGASETIGALSGAGTIGLNAHTLTTGGYSSTTISGSITGTGGLVKTGSGTLTLSGTNSYSGGTSITGGTLTAASTSALASTGAVSIASGAALKLDANLAIGALSGAGNVVLGANTLTFGDTTDTTLSGVASGTGGLAKTGSGTATLSGANNLSGAVSVNAGTLALTGTIGAATIAAGATLSSGGATTGAIANSGTVALGSTVLTAAGNITGTGAITFTIGGDGTGYIVNTTNTANYAPGAGTVTITPTVSGGTVLNGTKIALIRGSAGGTAPSFTGTTFSVTATGSATWTAAAGTSYVGTVDLNGYTIAANDTVLVASVSSPPPPPPPEVTTPTTPVVTTPVTPLPPATGVIDTSKPTFTNEDGAVQTGTVTFDGGTLKPTAPLTLTQTVNIESTNGVIDPNGSTVTLSGSVGGTGQLTVTGSGSLVVSNTVSNSGGLNVQSGSLTVAEGGDVSAPVTASGGLVTVNGKVSGPVTVESGATLGGNGLIAGDTSVSGILAPGNSPGTLVFTAPVTLNAGSVYQVEIDGTGMGTGAGNHDRVVVNGAAFTADGRLTPILRGIGGSATNGFTPSLGQSFTVISADSGVSGRFASLDQPASGLAAGTRMDVIYGSTAVALAVTPTSYANLAAAGLGQTVNQRAVGAALESFRPAAGGQASDPTAQALFDNLYTLSGGQIGPALNQLSGKIHADMLTADRVNRRQFGRAVEARQAAGHGASNAPEGAVEFLANGKVRSVAGLPDTGSRAGSASVWGQPLVGRGHSADDGNGGAVDRFTGGFMVGSDYAFDPEVKAGVALGFLRTRVKAENGLGEGTVDSYQATVYGSWTPSAAFVDAAFGYGYSRYDTTRSMVFGNVAGVAAGEADGTDLSADLSAGVRMTLDGNAWVEPRAGLRWDRLSRGGFTERGLPLLSLREEAETQNALRSSIGLRFGTLLNVGEVTVEPTGTLGWEHDWADVTSEATASLNGARFTALASRPGRDAAVVGAGVTVTMSRQLSVQVGYLGEIRRHENNHGLSAKLRWSW